MPETQAPVAVCLMGPTAAGKTELALSLARRLPVGLVSVDSAMVYRHMDIGSGKPPREVLAEFPHHLVDIREPWQQYSAAEFAADAEAAIRSISAAGRVPLLVGGTFLYFRSLTRGLSSMPSADPGFRAALDQRAETEGWPALHAELRQVDPAAAARIDPADRQRIQRALEVWHLSGLPISALQGRAQPRGDLRFLMVGLLPDSRQALHERIALRLRAMLAQGLVAEVEGLLAMPEMDPDRPALRAVGYRQICQMLAGEFGRGELESRILAATRQLARRQLTWLRGEHCNLWLEIGTGDLAARLGQAMETVLPQMQYQG